jgi:hypothetical protein
MTEETFPVRVLVPDLDGEGLIDLQILEEVLWTLRGWETASPNVDQDPVALPVPITNGVALEAVGKAVLALSSTQGERAAEAGHTGSLWSPSTGRGSDIVPPGRGSRCTPLAWSSLYDPADPMSKMFFNMLAVFAEFEADLLKMRTREGMAIARSAANSKAASPSSPPVNRLSSCGCTPPATTPSPN